MYGRTAKVMLADGGHEIMSSVSEVSPWVAKKTMGRTGRIESARVERERIKRGVIRGRPTRRRQCCMKLRS